MDTAQISGLDAEGRAGLSSHLSDDDSALFIDRELSLLRFQRRVFEEAQDERNPLLERVKFLAILGTNLDDFTVVRGPKLGLDPAKRKIVDGAVARLLRDANAYLRRHLVPQLAARGLHLVQYQDLTEAERADVSQHFIQCILPSLSRHGCGLLEQVPEIPGRGLNFAVVLRGRHGNERFAVFRVGDTVSPLVSFPWRRTTETSGDIDGQPPSAERGFVWLDQVLEAHLATMFPGMDPVSSHRFRVMREVDLAPPPDEPVHPLHRVDTLIRHRQMSPVVVLFVDRRMPSALLNALVDHLQTPRSNVRSVQSVSDFQRLWEVARIPRADLHEPELAPRLPAQLNGGSDPFDAIRHGDVLVHHPYESFQPIVDLIMQAGSDPDVQSLSMSLYRTDRESPVGHALLAALGRGKQVRVIVELNARFDEERNARWARTLERAGAQVVYGIAGLKVHAKMTMVARREGAQIRRYVHLSSGNYNAFTSKIYSDLGLLTCDDEVAADVADIFDFVFGSPQPARFRRLIVAPFTLRRTLGELIEREINWSRRGEQGHIILKMNALSDRDMIRLLYRASRTGVRIDLIVRGICCLRPGLPGVSENIFVRSIVGQFLEHSRTWYFRNGGREEAFIGSADLMSRNLDRRIEVVAPLTDPALVRRVRQEILGQYLVDNVKARRLSSDGTYSRVAPLPGESPFTSQTALLDIS